MPAVYPGAIYDPRLKENKAGEVYDPLKTTIIYAEDIVGDDDEIVAIETELGLNPKGEYESVADRLDNIGGGITSVVAGGGINIDATDPANPIVEIKNVPPIDIDIDGNITITPADENTDGYLSKLDYATFNGKQEALPLSNPGEILTFDDEIIALSPGTPGQVLTAKEGIDEIPYLAWETPAEPGAPEFIELTDAPASYADQAGKVVAVNSTEDALEFIEPTGGTKCTGAEINIGTDDEKFATPKAIADSDIAMLSDIPVINQGGLYGVNTETLAAAKTLTPYTDEIFQLLAPNASDRNITLATAGATAGDVFFIRNTDAYSSSAELVIYQGATKIDRISSTSCKSFMFDGTNWLGNDFSSANLVDTYTNLVAGRQAFAYANSVALGQETSAQTESVSIGYKSTSNPRGIAIGKYAQCGESGVSIGYESNAQVVGIAICRYASLRSNWYSIALGQYSQTYHYGETAINITGGSSIDYNHLSIRLSKYTTNNTPVEMLCAGVAAKRIVLRANSTIAFTGTVVARDNVNNHGAMYKIEGLIKRDGSNNTAMVGAATVTVVQEDDASWNVTVAADNTNEALVVTVTGDATNPTKWACVIEAVEVVF